MSVKKTKDRVLTCRVSHEDFEKLEQMIADAGMSKSEYFRDVVINKKAEINVIVKDMQSLIFYYNKASNNLNQIAYKANSAHLENRISESLYGRVLNALIDIRSLLLKGVQDADKS
ncbi:molybdopterin-guanine dinucleotide biosynthesis protein MobC [Erwinia sp. OLTSP20]|uniref:plasmid mobilization protein n=1 Tax=Enterobacterales TaxID=91347 RepID=UPI000C19B378|nr:MULTISPECIES: molybdopterin-guanine dinucleotide biosynthesis protein MobC [Enterobacterales]MCX8963072.1 molybdopterin-guanine dinucleotide biosynthesis protein MobC [Erwinia psidii]PII85131.1 molybdopterin-guanine dinucleotide biosynthesis protein MobC [Serratia sp. OLFL2]PIJ49356.1 molybdopterin-guanine dinucleotide biosynthesis protein MobC [Erwinia sp. OAMSP11]PIJ69750.1 molybdopterin-guanine dinucleotide biosynthesis protein MobC [Erwinia sp. OLSSP12]PIJ76234.1 molybdopterin-guanine d